MACRVAVWGCVPPTPIFMILHDLGVEKVGTTPLCVLLSIHPASDIFSYAFNITPIIFWLGFMIFDGFSMVVGGFDGLAGKSRTQGGGEGAHTHTPTPTGIKLHQTGQRRSKTHTKASNPTKIR